MKVLDDDFVDKDEILDFVNETEKLLAEDENKRTNKNLKKDCPDKVEKIEQASIIL